MKIKYPLFQLIAIVGVNFLPTGRTQAQTFTNLHNFTTANYGTNSDGAYPAAGLVLSGNKLFGTAYGAGPSGDGSAASGSGTLFSVNTDGTGFTNLHNFTLRTGALFSNSDGALPAVGSLVVSGNTLYGTALSGGVFGSGTLFAIHTDGSGFTNLHNFSAFSGPLATNSDGANPAEVILSGNTLFGMAQFGGHSGNGTLFAINTNGTGFTNLHQFSLGSGPHLTNADGVMPSGLLLLSNALYGTAVGGGSSGNGTVFKLDTNGGGFTNLYSFSATTSGPVSFLGYNGDGVGPTGLALSANTFYGSANSGGTLGEGTLFKINTDGSAFTNLHDFSATTLDASGYATNNDGIAPAAGLIASGNTLFGTAFAGGISHNGTVFAVNSDGTGFTILHSFTASDSNFGTNSDGVGPDGVLILSGDTLYGTATSGGTGPNGTVFGLALPPTPTPSLIVVGGNVILTWPTNTAGLIFTLQSATNLTAPILWDAVPLPSAVVNGQNTVTNRISGAGTFYRLSQ